MRRRLRTSKSSTDCQSVVEIYSLRHRNLIELDIKKFHALTRHETANPSLHQVVSESFPFEYSKHPTTVRLALRDAVSGRRGLALKQQPLTSAGRIATLFAHNIEGPRADAPKHTPGCGSRTAEIRVAEGF